MWPCDEFAVGHDVHPVGLIRPTRATHFAIAARSASSDPRTRFTSTPARRSRSAPRETPPERDHTGQRACPRRTPGISGGARRRPPQRRYRRRAGRTDGDGEPELEISQGAGRAAQPRPPRRSLDDPPDPAASPDPTGAGATHRHQLSAAPAHPAAGTPAIDFFHEQRLTVRTELTDRMLIFGE
jgi:hypothetical protein